MSRHRLDHGLVGNGHVLALVAPDARVDWLCLPAFDSPPALSGLLDLERGGAFGVEAEAVERLEGDPRVLRWRTTSPLGALEIEDFCPEGRPAFTRLITPRDPGARVRLIVDLRPDFGRARVGLSWVGDEAARVGDLWLTAWGAPLRALLTGEPVTLKGPVALTLSHGAPLHLDDPVAALQARLRPEPLLDALDEATRRDARCLLTHRYAPTGALIAAATTSIPEAIGEPRNWDYRYAWIRDGVFAAEALLSLGLAQPAADLLGFFARTIGGDAPQPLYTLHGAREIPESIVEGLSGFADTRPVRVGNAAATQTQHDSWGQLIWLAYQLYARGGADLRPLAPWLWGLVEGAARAWGAPDAGIWEFRDKPDHYTYSRAWCWVALDRGARLAAAWGEPARATAWAAEAARVRASLLDAATATGFFAQTLSGVAVDASSLQLARLGLIEPTDPRFQATIARCEAALLVDGLMRRYVVEDDFGQTTSTFSLCTLWWIEALALGGQLERARAAFARFLTYANPHGLFSEDVEPATGRLLGNFPQVYTHTGLINARLAIEAATLRAGLR
ncbi:hypothetical protein KKF91_07000 [Myxococcota bacterium]|nr:hypothetical protein [Myxococcota bacterium]